MSKNNELNKAKALKIDTELYIDKEDDYFHVFGDNTGFSYGHFPTKEEADTCKDLLSSSLMKNKP